MVLGIAAAVVGSQFSRAWPWIAIGIIIIAFGSMTPLAALPMTRSGERWRSRWRATGRARRPESGGSDEDLAIALAGIKPELPAAIGIVGDRGPELAHAGKTL